MMKLFNKFSLKKVPDILIVIAAFTVALTIRIMFLHQISVSFLDPLYLDGNYYNSWALVIVKGDVLGKDIFYGLPLYPYFLSLVYFIFGHNISIAQAANAVMDDVSCGLLYLVGAKIFNKTIGVTASLIFAFYAMSLYFDAFLGPASLSILLNLVIILMLLSIYKNPKSAKWSCAGLLLGISALANASVLLCAPFIVIWAFITFRHIGFVHNKFVVRNIHSHR